jgi:hypothetical protein
MQAIVELTPSTANGTVNWELCTDAGCGNGNPGGGYPNVVLPPKQSEDVIFIINNPPGSAITFPKDPYDAIWIQPGQKPTAKAYNDAGQLGAPKLSKSKTVLVLRDKNKGQAMDFHYALNFSDGSKIDPVIKNGGGALHGNPSLPLIGSNPAVALVAGLIIGAVVAAVLLRRMVRPRGR